LEFDLSKPKTEFNETKGSWMVTLNHKISLVLVALSAGLVACTDNKPASASAVMSVPEFAQRLNAQKSVDYGGVFAVVTINDEQQRFEFSDNAEQSFEVVGIEKDADNDIRVEWWEVFQGTNLALGHQEAMLFVASTDTSLTISSDYNREEYDDDGDGKPNLTERENGTCPVAQPCAIVAPIMIDIPAGDFLMGASQPGFNDNEYPQHPVSVDAFGLSETEVTWAEWDICVDANACEPVEVDERFAGIENLRTHPLAGVSYPQIMDYITWINEGLGGGFRLPTEAEFEYALRAGTTSVYPYGDDVENYCEHLNGFNSPADCEDGYQFTSPVKSFPANAYGLYDMSGNVGEWTADCRHDSYVGAPDTAIAWLEENGGNCNEGVLRGTNFYFNIKAYRSSYRRIKTRAAAFAEFHEGFRLARD